MKFQLRISTDNAAFQDGDCGREIARILSGLADKLHVTSGHLTDFATNLLDNNGNVVGTAEMVGDHDDNDE